MKIANSESGGLARDSVITGGCCSPSHPVPIAHRDPPAGNRALIRAGLCRVTVQTAELGDPRLNLRNSRGASYLKCVPQMVWLKAAIPNHCNSGGHFAY